MIKRNAKVCSPSTGHADASLESRYGAIGISAVAAALHFKSEAKNPAYAPATSRLDEEQLDEERIAELAA